MNKIKAGIVGGAGYTGGELIRILLQHPAAEIVFVHSKTFAGKPVHIAHPDLFGDTDLKFTDKVDSNIEVLYLCMGHGESRKFLEANNVPNEVKIIDLSQDFRIDGSFGNRKFVYGMPELQRDAVSKANNIANPGCFATCIQLGLYPLAKNGLLKDEVHVSGITGSTGAGKSLSETTHFTWRNNNISSYKVLEHQHLGEIGKYLNSLQNNIPDINFIPYRGNFSRGILCTTYTKSDISADKAKAIFEEYYSEHPFVHILDEAPDLKQVVNTNKCFLHVGKVNHRLVITSAIDNLLKGASGQAVQNMNLMFDLDETTGLHFKAIAF